MLKIYSILQNITLTKLIRIVICPPNKLTNYYSVSFKSKTNKCLSNIQCLVGIESIIVLNKC